MLIFVETTFLLQLLLSFIVGGSYIAFTVWISEKFGSRIGGLMIGLPSTLLVGLLFIAWSQNSDAAVSAIPIVPAAIAANSLFLVVFIYLYKYGRAAALLGGIVVWFILTLPLVFFSIKSLLFSLAFAAVFFALALCFLRKLPHRKLEKLSLTRKEVVWRVVFTGSLVALSVYLGKAVGPLWGGMFASFPAAFSSSLLILENKHGIKFASSVARTAPYGSMGSVLFAVMFYVLVPTLGVVAGTIIAYCSALIFGLVISKTLLKKN